MKIDLPDIDLLIKKILPIKVHYVGDFINHPILGEAGTQNIEQWRSNYLKELKHNNLLDDISKFRVFIVGLLSRASRGEMVAKLYNDFNDIKKFDDFNKLNIKTVLKNIGYRFQDQGTKTIIDVKDVFLKEYHNSWDNYFKEAKKKYKNNFLDDAFLKVKGVGFKVRDLALSCFLKEYSANDFHVVDVLVRTGLVLYGYGDLNFGTNPNDKKNYLFLRNLIIKISKYTKYSPGEIDRIFWHFGRAICKKRPLCEECLINSICLTYKNK